MSFTTSLKAFGHYIEQPAVIRRVEKRAGLLGLAGMAGLWGWDAYRAQPDQRRKIAVRDALVLGATGLGTWLATRKLMMPFLNPAEIAEARDALKKAVDGLRHKYPKPLQSLMLKETRTVDEFRQLLNGMRETAHSQNASAAADFEADVAKVLPVELEESFLDSLKKMRSFFLVGGASVLSGLLGGLAANKINGEDSRKATVCMVKEGVFQFIANIALCAVGASLGIAAINTRLLKNTLARWGSAGKLLRTGIIGAGLSLGIVGGGAVANWIGDRFVNPLLDGVQNARRKTGKRKIEFCDAILHLDDLPTALALAGVAVMEPFVPLFFMFSGYRTGIGYRNNVSPASKRNEPPAQAVDVPAYSTQTAYTQPLSFASNPLFQHFQQRQPSAAAFIPAPNPFARTYGTGATRYQ